VVIQGKGDEENEEKGTLPNGTNLSVMMANSLPFKGRVGVGMG